MTRKEAMRLTMQADTLRSLGFTPDEAEQLRRISMALHSWFERECGTGNGCIERDKTTNKPYWLNSDTMKRYPIRDMEAGAMKRLAGIIAERNKRNWHPVMPEPVSTYIQGDPRGASLYIIRPGDVPEGADVEAYYNRGICVY